MGKENWEYVSERDDKESKLTAGGEEGIVKEKLGKLSDIQEQKTKKEKSHIVIKCKDCGALVSQDLWNKYGRCPICLGREKREARAKAEAREKAEARKKSEAEKKAKEISEREAKAASKFPIGFGLFVAVILGLIKKFRG